MKKETSIFEARTAQSRRRAMGRLLLTTLLLFFFAGGAKADEVEIGDGGTTNNQYLPGYNYYNYSYTQQIYTAAEVGVAGTINSIAFKNTGAEKTRTYNIYMAHTDKDDFTSGTDWVAISDGDLVFSGELTFAVGEWTTIELNTPFAYNGTSNLIVSVADNSGNYSNSPHMACLVFDATSQAIRAYRDNSAYDITAPGVNGTILNVKNQIQLDITTSGVVYSKPTNLTLDNLTATTAAISWTAPTTTETITGYAYQYKQASEGNDAWSNETTVTTTSASLTELTPSTAYNFRVKTLYGTNESGFATMNFTTDCGAITTFPWSEDFESYSTGNYTNPCWVNEHIEGGGNKIFTISTTTNGTNSTHQLQLPDQTAGTMTMLRLPEMTLPQGTNYQFVLDVYRSTSTYGNNYQAEGIRVFASADGNISGAIELAFIPRHYSVTSGNIPAEETAGWYTYELPIGFSGTCYIILRGESQYSSSTNMDNFVVEEAPACLKPTNLYTTNLTATSATLSWTERGDATNWVLQYGTDETFADGTYTEVNVSGTPSKELTGLTTETVYYARVKAVKGNDEGDWSDVCRFWPTATIELVLNDGTSTNPYTPFYGYNVNNGTPNKSQFIITADKLEDVNLGSTIKKLTLHSSTSSNASASWGDATFNVYLKEVSESSFADATFVEDGLTTVYQGSLTVADYKMEIIFDQDYTYYGGNLLVGFELTAAGTSKTVYWFGGYGDGNNTVYTYMGSSSQTGPSLISFMPKVTFSYLQAELACDKPKNLAAANITHEQATITWTSDENAWNIAWSTDPDFDPAAQTTTSVSNVSEKTYTITGLNLQTDYYVAVQSACGGEWSKKIHFKTTAVAVVVGDNWSDDFEGTECGWELINGDLTNVWTWGEATNNGGTHALYISNDGGTTNAYTNNSGTKVFATKLLTFADSKYEFSYDWLAKGESSWDFLRVALVPATEMLTAGTDYSTISSSSLPTGWIALDGGNNLSGVTTWQDKTVFVKVIAGNYYLLVAWRNDTSSGTNPPAAIDNVSINRMACSADVEDLAVSNITTTTADITWTAGDADEWQVAVKTDSGDWTILPGTYTTNSATLTGLTPGTYYQVKARAYCDANNQGTWCESIAFTTDCAVIDLSTTAYSENFDSYTGTFSGTANNLPVCWNYINTCTNDSYKGYPAVYNSDYYSHSGNNNLRFISIYGSDPQDQYAILPVMDHLAGTQITLWARCYNSTSSFKVGTMTDPTDVTTFEEIGEHVFTDNDYNTCQEFTFNIPANASGNYVAIMIEAATSSRTSNGVFIDDITISSSVKPTDLAVTLTPNDNTSVALNWTENGTSTEWVLEYGTAADFTGATSVEVTGTPSKELTGLTAEASYYARVCAVNSDGVRSAWSNTVRFEPTLKQVISSGTVTNDHHLPSNIGYYSYSQQIYTTAELGEAGLIESIDFFMTSAGEYTRNLDIYMVSTGKSSFADGSDWIAVAAADKVFSGNVTFTSDSWTTITLDETFIYDGTQNVAIIVDDNTGPVTVSDFRAFETTTNQAICEADLSNNIIPNEAPAGTCFSSKNQIRIAKSPLGSPTYFKATEVGPDFAILNWTENANATEWVIDYNGTTINVTEKPYTLTGLAPETTYTVKVRPACDENLWSSKITFTTLVNNPVPTDVAVSDITSTTASVSWTGYGDSYNVRYREKDFFPEGFESGTIPDGWTIEGDNQDASKTWRVGVGDYSTSTGTHSGEKNVLINHNATNNETYLITPAMNFSGQSNLTLSFWYINREWNGDKDGLGVYYRVGTGEWNELWITEEAHGTWTNQTVALTGLDANYQIGFKMTDNWGYGVGLDDIDIVNLVSGDWVTIAGLTEKSTDVTGLTPNTQYVYQVQSVKGGSASDWSESALFTTLSFIELADDDSSKPDGEKNAAILSKYNNQIVDITLSGRTLYKDDDWNTLCLPFNASLTGDLADATLMELDRQAGSYAHITGFEDGTLYLNFKAAESITAGIPYIIKWAGDGTNNLNSPTFSRVTITSTTPTVVESEDAKVQFIGTYSPVSIDKDDKSSLFLGTDNTLFYPNADGYTVKAFRAYFHVGDGSNPAPVMRTVLNFGDGATAIETVNHEPFTDNHVYDLAGRRIEGVPTAKGLYIVNGKKIIIK